MKICILTKFYPPHSTEGIPRIREIYAKGLARAGHDVHVITSGHDGYTFERDGVTIHEIPAIRADEVKTHFEGFSGGEHVNYQLSYSYRVYQKIKSLLPYHPFDLVDSPLWDLEGYITKLKLPELPMVIRLETTSRHMREINTGDAGPLSIGDKFERNFLVHGDAYVFDSWAIYQDVKRLYFYDFVKKPWRVVHHGIESESSVSGGFQHAEICNGVEAPSDRPLKLLYVGRLEKRKGSDFLIQKVIPEVLKQTHNVEFHIVGRDCSVVDGFLEEHGVNYQQWGEKKFPDAIGAQVRFYGYLSDKEVERLYRESDVIVNFSRYESFGLLYLEAMRMKKLQIVFRNEAICEILHGCDGPIQVELEDAKFAVDSIVKLEGDRSELVTRGQQSYEHFKTYFTDEVMLRNCEQFFEVFLRQQRPRIIHIMYALDQYDGVSNIAIDYYLLTKELGYDSVLTGRFVHPSLAELQMPIEDCSIRDTDIVFVHYWGFSDFLPRYHEIPGKKVILFHNVTNPYFFKPQDPGWQGTAGAFAQMRDLNFANHVATFSYFSQGPVRAYFGDSLQYHVLPPLMDSALKKEHPYNGELVSTLQSEDFKKILFVGRVVLHKKQDELVELLALLECEAGIQAKLYLVGGIDEAYGAKLMKNAENLGLAERVFLCGKVSEEDLIAYYKGCDLFVSMSEHEGFCIPLIDAMIHELPVVGFAQPAVAETIGCDEAVFAVKNLSAIVEKITPLLEDSAARESVIERQNERVMAFSHEAVKRSLEGLIAAVADE